MNFRLTASTTALLVAATAASAHAQRGADSIKNHATDTISRETPHWHFDGRISTINPSGHQITIAADSIPMQYGGKTTLPYDVPPTMDMAQFKKDMVINADLVVRDNRTRVENLEFGATKKKVGLKNPHNGLKNPHHGIWTAPKATARATAKDTGHAGIVIEKKNKS